jgi:REP element-mobilizing transposase RayT
MNSFEYSSTETEQLEVKQKDTQTVSHEPGPVSVSVAVPEIETAVETKVEEEILIDHPKSDEIFEVETLPQISTELTFSCLLIPRFSDHYLAGDITKDLEVWMKEVCISYGWRPGSITIRPGYMQWAMSVPLTANPAQFMKIIRQQTSLKIFEDYPRFSRKNISHDFWAPGFSIVYGEKPQSADDINNFILQIRRQQGIY